MSLHTCANCGGLWSDPGDGNWSGQECHCGPSRRELTTVTAKFEGTDLFTKITRLTAERDRLTAQLADTKEDLRDWENMLDEAEAQLASQSGEVERLRAERDIWKDAIYLCTITESVHAAVKWMCAYHDEQMLRLKTKYYDPPRYPISPAVSDEQGEVK